jgi:hypothetical protein
MSNETQTPNEQGVDEVIKYTPLKDTPPKTFKGEVVYTNLELDKHVEEDRVLRDSNGELYLEQHPGLAVYKAPEGADVEKHIKEVYRDLGKKAKGINNSTQGNLELEDDFIRRKRGETEKIIKESGEGVRGDLEALLLDYNFVINQNSRDTSQVNRHLLLHQHLEDRKEKMLAPNRQEQVDYSSAAEENLNELLSKIPAAENIEVWNTALKKVLPRGMEISFPSAGIIKIGNIRLGESEGLFINYKGGPGNIETTDVIVQTAKGKTELAKQHWGLAAEYIPDFNREEKDQEEVEENTDEANEENNSDIQIDQNSDKIRSTAFAAYSIIGQNAQNLDEAQRPDLIRNLGAIVDKLNRGTSLNEEELELLKNSISMAKEFGGNDINAKYLEGIDLSMTEAPSDNKEKLDEKKPTVNEVAEKLKLVDGLAMIGDKKRTATAKLYIVRGLMNSNVRITNTTFADFLKRKPSETAEVFRNLNEGIDTSNVQLRYFLRIVETISFIEAYGIKKSNEVKASGNDFKLFYTQLQLYEAQLELGKTLSAEKINQIETAMERVRAEFMNRG